MQLHIPFSEIPEQGMHVAIIDQSLLPEELLGKAGPVNAALQLTKKSEGRIEVQGTLQVEFRLSCDRCLAGYDYALDAKMQLIVELPENERHWRLQEIELTGSDLDTLQVIEPVVDLEDILRQQIYLGLPAKQLCRENCLGLCSHCGYNLNEGQCGCHGGKLASSPFAVLASYKKQK
ncbi:MAG TPA: DUF177 domain-containing protein [Desulfobulbaceae bacterium]|nr:DUF177 domain-containing protein [Desulfobulbaceae bacterium]